MTHPNELLFREGVDHIFNLWESLKLAVRNEWGGPESLEKRNWMLDVIVSEFSRNGKNMEVYDIEDILTQIMSDEFETILEDDSAYIVAKDILRLYKTILARDPSFLNKLREAIERRKGNSNSLNIVSNQVESSDDDEYSEGEEGVQDQP